MDALIQCHEPIIPKKLKLLAEKHIMVFIYRVNKRTRNLKIWVMWKDLRVYFVKLQYNISQKFVARPILCMEVHRRPTETSNERVHFVGIAQVKCWMVQ